MLTSHEVAAIAVLYIVLAIALVAVAFPTGDAASEPAQPPCPCGVCHP